MKAPALLLLCGTFILPAESVRATEPPDLVGAVTRVASGSDFDVNGYRVLCGPDTASAVYVSTNESSNNAGCPDQTPYLGETARIYGRVKKKKLTVQATQIDLHISPFSGIIEGSAVIDAMPARDAATPERGGVLVQADGFQILIDKSTQVKWVPPVDSFDKIGPGEWIEYKGKFDNSGVLLATSAKLTVNYVTTSELALESRDEFDPTAVPASKKQGSLGVALIGIDPRKLPSYNDPEMQARVNEIGNRLVPAYQRSLPDGDIRKITFRFQLVDTPLMRDALTLSNGLILVPRQVVERMQNDSQLATVLADNIACALERQEYRLSPSSGVTSAAIFALEVSDPFGLGIAEAAKMQTYVLNQSGRVSLTLLHDAGYDIYQAPRAWWRLAPADVSQLPLTPAPERAVYLYQMLGALWGHRSAAAESVQ